MYTEITHTKYTYKIFYLHIIHIYMANTWQTITHSYLLVFLLLKNPFLFMIFEGKRETDRQRLSSTS